MRFVPFSEAAERFRGKSVALVGSGPGCLDNAPGFVDSHDVVVRVNNYKTGFAQGFRCDVFYSFFGTSIKKTSAELVADGVQLCMCKLPKGRPIESEWHIRTGRLAGIEYDYIYTSRATWWPCDVFVPDAERFLRKFELLGKHQPTTGFAGILDVLQCGPSSMFLTGFDFFSSGIHNVDEKWRPGDPSDPICHRPDLEAAWIRENSTRYPMTFDARLTDALRK